MTDFWKFSNSDIAQSDAIIGGSIMDCEQNDIKGGMSVVELLCKNQPKGDSERFPFFKDLVVPFGLVSICSNESSMSSKEEEEEGIEAFYEDFDNLFSLSAMTLGKSKQRRTRKKIKE